MDPTHNKPIPSHVLRRQARELEEQRILGLAPLAVDAVTGNSISPHVPTMLSTAPWYRKDLQRATGAGGREANMTIAHHLEGSDLTGAKDIVLPESQTVIFEVAEEKERKGVAATLLPKHAIGACKNCGATTHKTENCLRPKRKVGSVVTGSKEGSGSKLFEASLKDATVELRSSSWTEANFQRTWEAYRKRELEQENLEGPSSRLGPRTEGSTLFEARTAAEGLKVGNHDLTHLPKYLENLDDDTFYDPRTRSMRGNPNALKRSDPAAATTVYRGDNALLHTREYHEFLDQQSRYLSGETKTFAEIQAAGEVREKMIENKAKTMARRLFKLLMGETGSTPAVRKPNESNPLVVRALYSHDEDLLDVVRSDEHAGEPMGIRTDPKSVEDDYSPL